MAHAPEPLHYDWQDTGAFPCRRTQLFRANFAEIFCLIFEATEDFKLIFLRFQ
jgi:hypothetical protein